MTHLAIQIPGGKASDRFGPAGAGAMALVVLSASRPDAPAAAVGFVNTAANLVVLSGRRCRLGFAALALLWVAALALLPSRPALGVRTAASP